MQGIENSPILKLFKKLVKTDASGFKKPKRKRQGAVPVIALGVICIAALIFLGQKFVLQPLKAEKAELSAQKIAVERKINLATREITGLSAPGTEIPEEENVKLDSKRYFFSSKNSFYDDVLAKVEDYDVTLKGFKFLEEKIPAKYFSVHNCRLSLYGRYKNLGEFLFFLRSNPVLFDLHSMTLKLSEERPNLNLTMNLDLYARKE